MFLSNHSLSTRLHREDFEVLLNLEGPNLPNYPVSLLHSACRIYSLKHVNLLEVEKVKQLLKYGADPNWKNCRSCTMLLLPNLVHELEEIENNPIMKDQEKDNATFATAELINVLLQHNASMYETDSCNLSVLACNLSAFERACRNLNTELMKMFILYGVDVERPSNSFCSPPSHLCVGFRPRSIDCLKTLVKYNAAANSIKDRLRYGDRLRSTDLELAIQMGYESPAKFLLTLWAQNPSSWCPSKEDLLTIVRKKANMHSIPMSIDSKMLDLIQATKKEKGTRADAASIEASSSNNSVSTSNSSIEEKDDDKERVLRFGG